MSNFTPKQKSWVARRLDALEQRASRTINAREQEHTLAQGIRDIAKSVVYMDRQSQQSSSDDQ